MQFKVQPYQRYFFYHLKYVNFYSYFGYHDDCDKNDNTTLLVFFFFTSGFKICLLTPKSPIVWQHIIIFGSNYQMGLNCS